MLTVVEDLREWNFGDFEGKTIGVNVAKPKADRPAGGYGGGNRGGGYGGGYGGNRRY